MLIVTDSELSSRGLEFSKALADFLECDELDFMKVDSAEKDKWVLWCATTRGARQTASRSKHLSHVYVEWRALREIEVGVCDGLSAEQVKARFPHEHRSRIQDKLSYRYPRGESYFDVITRLEPIIFELERRRSPMLIVGSLAVLRCLYAYFLDLPMEELPFLSIPLHTLIRLDPKAYGCKEKRVKLVQPNEEDDDENIENVKKFSAKTGLSWST